MTDAETTTLRRVLAALCPRCHPGHVLENDRVWAFCGAQRILRDDSPFTEAELIPLIRAGVHPPRPRGSLSAVVGQWPGDETDEQIEDALREMS